MSKDTTEAIHRMLADRYTGSEWAYLVEVPDGTGMKKQRTADAIAIGLWAKNAGQFHGFEVKSSRSDWTRELQEPEKSRRWREVVTSFWLVAGRGVAKLEEVPPDWGFLEVATNGESLKIRKQPLHVERGSVPINVVGSMLRKGIDCLPVGVSAKLQDVARDVRKSYESGREDERRASTRLLERNKKLEAEMQRLSQLLGRHPEHITADDMVASVVKAANAGRLSNITNVMRNVQTNVTNILRGLSDLDTRVEGLIAEFDRIGDTVDSSKEST
jgi:hypothetical protein